MTPKVQKAVDWFRYFKTLLQQKNTNHRHSHHNFHTITTQSCFPDRCIVVTTFQTPSAQWFDKHWSAATTIIKTTCVINRSQHQIMADFVIDTNDDIFTKQHPETLLKKIKQLWNCVTLPCHFSCVVMFLYNLKTQLGCAGHNSPMK